jgi:hypothetical protein
MAYSGKYIPKNLKKYRGDPDKVTYRSHWEKLCFLWCDRNDDIKHWSSDLKITFNNGQTILVEIKPAKETEPPKNANKSKRYIGEAMTYVKNMNKWEAANSFAKDRGWEFQIWTENTLKSMGIMKDQKGKLKPLKPLKPYRKKPKKKI